MRHTLTDMELQMSEHFWDAAAVCMPVSVLFNDAVSTSDYVVPSGRMINEWKRLWKEVVVL